jgi:hypothetical protein
MVRRLHVPENDLLRADAKKAGNNRSSGGATGFGTSRKGEKGKRRAFIVEKGYYS